MSSSFLANCISCGMLEGGSLLKSLSHILIDSKFFSISFYFLASIVSVLDMSCLDASQRMGKEFFCMVLAVGSSVTESLLIGD